VNSITSNEVAILETFGVTDIEGIDYDYCLVRFVGTGDFYIRLTNITGSDSFTKVILGIDVIWVGAKTTL